MDHTTVDLAVRTLAKGRAPGPDGVHTEARQSMPDSMKQALADLFGLMWIMGTDTWKQSYTVMTRRETPPRRRHTGPWA